MRSTFDKDEQALATERFKPTLNEYYNSLFEALTIKMGNTFPSNRAEIIKEEIIRVSEKNINGDVEALKYIAALSVLVDLSLQGWAFDIQNGTLILKMDIDNFDDKQRIRYRLSAERNAQFKSESISSFITQMETEKNYRGAIVSIRNLIGDKNLLIEKIKNGERVCDPYIQLVTASRDNLTGYKLSDIWRYFRYTWSIPYKTMPGRNIFYLVRDRLQAYHPIIGIFALGNSVLNLTVRDDDIGWTVEAIKRNMAQLSKDTTCEQIISGTDGKRIKTHIHIPIETEDEHIKRSSAYADKMLPLLRRSVEESISELFLKDLGYHRNTKHPKPEKIADLLRMAEEYSEISINNKNNEKSPKWEEEAQSNLFKRKRASELAKLLETKICFNTAKGTTNSEQLLYLLSSEAGRKAIHTALIANRKRKIGSNMMDIIVCGAIPPYNELLSGKLISILACSPKVVRDYTKKYSKQISEIASRMKGSRVVRDSRLVYLGTTSLYAVGSSQYNRIKVPLGDNNYLEYRKMGITEGYGTVFFSKETTAIFSRLLELQDGGKRINHVFGEGTSPRFRMISRGLSSIGIRADAFLKHYSPRIVYSINLAKNTNEYLLGFDNDVEYNYDINNDSEVNRKTQELIDYWYTRWLEMRLTSIDIEQRLNSFNIESILLGNI